MDKLIQKLLKKEKKFVFFQLKRTNGWILEIGIIILKHFIKINSKNKKLKSNE